MVEAKLAVDSDPMKNDNSFSLRTAGRGAHSFPLTSIAQLCTYCVALVTCVDFKVFGNRLEVAMRNSPENVFGAVAVASFIGFAIGAMIGLGQLRRWQGMIYCGTAGAIVAVLLAAAYAAPARPAQAIAAICLPLASTLLLRCRTP